MFRLFVMTLLFCSSCLVLSSADEYIDLLSTLISNVDKLSRSMEERKILDRDFGEKIRDKLADITRRIDGMQNKINAIEASMTGSKQLTGLESKIDEFGKKLVDQQSAIKNEARDISAVTRSFKGSLEEGIKKMVNTLNSMKKEKDDGGSEEILESIDEVKKAVDGCTVSSSQTRKRLDDVFSNLLQEWTTAHKQMREIDIKLNQMNNTSGCKGRPHVDNAAELDKHVEDVRLVADMIRRDYKRLEELEPKIIHAIRVSTEIENVEVDEEDREPARILSRNLSTTLKGLQSLLEKHLKSIREGTEIIDEFLVKPQAAKERSSTLILQNTVEETLNRLEKNLNKMLMTTGEHIRIFLSTEGLSRINALRTELQRSADMIRRENESTLKWKTSLQEGVTQIQHLIFNVTEEVRKCSSPRGSLKPEIERMLRNSMG